MSMGSQPGCWITLSLAHGAPPPRPAPPLTPPPLLAARLLDAIFLPRPAIDRVDRHQPAEHRARAEGDQQGIHAAAQPGLRIVERGRHGSLSVVGHWDLVIGHFPSLAVPPP